MAETNETKYVSWRALLTSLVSAVALTLTITFFMVQSFSTALEKKVDSKLFDQSVLSLCEATKDIKENQRISTERTRRLELLIERIGMKLKIDPNTNP